MSDTMKTAQLDIILSLGSMCAILAFLALMTGLDSKKKRALFFLETGAAVLLISTRLVWIYDGLPGPFSRGMAVLSNFLDYICVDIVLFAVNLYMKEVIREAEGKSADLKRFKLINMLLAVDAALTCLSPFTGIYYYIDETNSYNRGPAIGLNFAIPLIVALLFISVILQYYGRLSRNKRLPLLLFAILPLPAAVMQFFFLGLESVNITVAGLAILLYLFDLTDIKKNADMSERAIAANEAKSAFLSNMSHEIRTPINAILGMNEMILREADDPRILSHSGNIERAGSSLLGIVNDILDISRIESGKMELILADYDLSELISDLVNIISVRAEMKGLQLVTDIDPTLPCRLSGDEVRIKQIILNLLTNAVKYTKEGSVTFQVSCEERFRESDRVVLKVAVTDTGIGIREEDINRLFFKFERIEEERNRNIEGTGLGLPITKKLLNMMGSDLMVESEYGKGSTFCFLLEQSVISWDELGDYQKLSSEQQKDQSRHQGKLVSPDARILVVDDYAMNLEVVSGLLKETLIQVDTAISGDEALKLAGKNRYDIIFMDYMMPGKNGIETLKELRSQKNGPNVNVPVVCLTADAISGAREKYLSQGFDGYLTKPVDSEMLEKILIKYLPADKVTIAESGEEAASAALPKELSRLSCLEIVDVDAGIQAGGSPENYLKILKMFYDSLDKRVGEITAYYSADDITDYTIKVHALKTGFRTIGAFELGEAALSLEIAGKNHDTEYIKSHHEEFLKKIGQFKETLEDVFEIGEGQEQEVAGRIANEEEMERIFAEIRAAAADMDCDKLDSIFDTMKEYTIPKEHRELYDKLQEASEEYAYRTILMLLDRA